MQWSNWSRSVAATPERFARPTTQSELATLVTSARKLRVTGAGHSFMPLCETDGTLISLADYEGTLEIAPDRETVWAPAGWGLDRLTAALWAEGLSLINQGDINPQSLAGATATGTHGTGETLGSIATQACGFRLMQADGSMYSGSASRRVLRTSSSSAARPDQRRGSGAGAAAGRGRAPEPSLRRA